MPSPEPERGPEAAGPRAAERGASWRRLVPVAVSGALLALLYAFIDPKQLGRVLLGADLGQLLLGIALVAPTTALSAWRFRTLAPVDPPVEVGESVRLFLAGASLNMVLPSKLGDLGRAWFVRRRGHLSGPGALAVVVFERAADLLALLSWCVFGLLLAPSADPLTEPLSLVVGLGLAIAATLTVSRRASEATFRLLGRLAPPRLRGRVGELAEVWDVMQAGLGRDPARLGAVALQSASLWLLHLVQIWIFAGCLGKEVPLVTSLGLTPLAIVVGLLPLTFAGVGTRDAALVFLYRDLLPPAAGAALGVLCTLRLLVPALAGIPFLGRYLTAGEMPLRLETRPAAAPASEPAGARDLG